MADRLIADRYRLLRQVSAGDGVTYWQASDTLLDRQVLVELVDLDPSRVARFADELRTTARTGGGRNGRLLDGRADADAAFAVYEWPESPPTQELAQVPPPPPPAARRRAPPPRARSRGSRAPALVVLLMALPLAVGVIVVAKLLAPSSSATALPFALPTVQAATSTAAARAPGVTPTAARATPTAAPRANATAAPTRAPGGGERVRITNTDGIGVALRDGPDGQRLPGKGYDEGVTVTVLERQGAWAHIRGDDGREGWVLAVTVPAGH